MKAVPSASASFVRPSVTLRTKFELMNWAETCSVWVLYAAVMVCFSSGLGCG